MKSETKLKFTITITLMLICVLLCLGIFLLQNNKKPLETQPLVLSPEPVNEYSTFFALVNNVNQYFNYVKEGNSEAVYSLLFPTYIEENMITTNNIFDKIKLENNEQILQANNIYYQEINGNYLYLVEGNLIINSFEENSIINDHFQIFVLIDYNNFTYAIYPITADEEIKSPLTENNISMEYNGYNQTSTTGVISSNYICNLYFGDFLNKITVNIEESYEYLSSAFQQQYSLNNYMNYIDSNMDKLSSEIQECTAEEENEKRIYSVVDGNGNQFTFKENSIMNYEVEFSLNAN